MHKLNEAKGVERINKDRVVVAASNKAIMTIAEELVEVVAGDLGGKTTISHRETETRL